MKISELFKDRAKGVTALLTSIHHEAMDVLISAELESFTLDVVIDLLAEDEAICSDEIISENRDRLRLIAARVLDGLGDTGLIRELPDHDGTFVWSLCDRS